MGRTKLTGLPSFVTDACIEKLKTHLHTSISHSTGRPFSSVWVVEGKRIKKNLKSKGKNKCSM